MDPSTETTLLLVLGLACVAALVLLPFKEDEDSSGIRAGVRASVRGSVRRGEPRQVSKQITLEVADTQQGKHRGTVTTVLRENKRNSDPEEGDWIKRRYGWRTVGRRSGDFRGRGGLVLEGRYRRKILWSAQFIRPKNKTCVNQM